MKRLIKWLSGCAVLLSCSCSLSGGYVRTEGTTVTEVYASASLGKDSTDEKQTARSHSSASSTESRSFRAGVSGIIADAALGVAAPAVRSLGSGAWKALGNVGR